jgi:hypothetical protein
VRGVPPNDTMTMADGARRRTGSQMLNGRHQVADRCVGPELIAGHPFAIRKSGVGQLEQTAEARRARDCVSDQGRISAVGCAERMASGSHLATIEAELKSKFTAKAWIAAG